MPEYDAPTLLMVTRSGRPEHSAEAEPMLVARTSQEVILVLDDGEEIRVSRKELRAAVDGE